MKTYPSQATVEPGIYFNLRRLHFVTVGDRGPLAGHEGESYRAVPAVLILLVAPLVGLAYVIFLPLIGFLVVGRWAAAAVGHRLRHPRQAGRELPVRVEAPVPRPASLHIERRRAVHAPFQDVVARALAEDRTPSACRSVSHRSPQRPSTELQRVECREGWMRVVKQRRPACTADQRPLEVAESWTLSATDEGTEVVVECDLPSTDQPAAAAIADDMERTLASLEQA